MSAFPPPQQPQQPPQAPKKSGVPKSLIIIGVAVVLLGIGFVILLVIGVGGYLYFSNNAPESVAVSPSTSGEPASKSSPGSAAERPTMTPAQQAAIAGGQTVMWSDQGISWTVPSGWSKSTEDKSTLLWRSPGTWEAASLIASISPMSADFPVETSLEAYHDQAMEKLGRGEVTEAKWLELDGVRGVMWREARPEDEEDPQRLQWLGYRSYLGQTQLVNIMLSSRGKEAQMHEDAMYAILYSTKIPH